MDVTEHLDGSDFSGLVAVCSRVSAQDHFSLGSPVELEVPALWYHLLLYPTVYMG